MMLLRLLLLAACCGLAAAYDRPAASKEFRDLDTDESGHVGRDEIDGHLDRQFEVRLPSPLAKLESTAAHWLRSMRFGSCLTARALWQAEAQAWMDFYDTDKDGRVHVDEYFGLPKSNQRYWDSVDINNDECVPLLLAQPRALSLTLRRGRSYTDPDEMRINRDRSHPNRVDTFLKYYDDNTDGSIHKHEFDAKHNEL